MRRLKFPVSGTSGGFISRGFPFGRPNSLVAIAAAAAVTALSGGSIARAADTLLNSFETPTGFDYPGDTGGGIAYATQQTTGVTNGSYSLNVTGPQSYWIAVGYLNVDPTVIAANTTLKYDLTTTSLGAYLIPIFHTNPDSGPGSGGYFQGTGTYVPPNTTQTVSYDYSGLGITAATTMTLQFQGSTGNALNFYMDNVRVAPPVGLTSSPGAWMLNGSGNWVDAANWDPSIPGAPGSTATFGTHGGTITTTSQITVTLDAAVTLAIATFDKGGGGYKLAGTSAMGVTGNITVNSGTHTIAAPLNITSGAAVNVAAGSSLTATNLTVTGYGGLTKNGDGALTADKIQNCSLDIEGGTVDLAPGNAQANGFIYGVTVANGTTFNLNGASLRTNGIYSAGTPGTINLGGGALTTGEYSGYAYYGAIAGAGSVTVGGESATGQAVTWGGAVTYTGATTVANGNTLALATNLASTSALTVGGTDGSAVPSQVQLLSDTTSMRVIKAGTLTLDATAKIDLQDNKLITGSPIGSWNGSTYTGVTGLIKSGRNGGGWGGAGLVTSQTTATTSNLTTLGTATAAQAKGIAATATTVWAGQTVTGSDTLVMYTYGGDANLDGKINVDDYTRIDFNVPLGATGWFNGDFNYDGKINVDDYTIIDFNVGIQGAQFPTSSGVNGGSSGLTAVPEPTGLSMLGLIAAGALRRRRRN